MCGRYATSKDVDDLMVEFDAEDATDGAWPGADYNVAPTKEVLAVVRRHPRDDAGQPDPDRTVRGIRVMRWGLIPAWAKDRSVGAKMINARAESVATKSAFRTSLAKRRCLLPADGWYEWQREGTWKQPYFMTSQNGASLAMAGVWTAWRDPASPDAPMVISVAVLTTQAVGRLTDIHDRMPLLMRPESWAAWLDPDSADVSGLLAPSPLEIVESLEVRPVSTAVNHVHNNAPELLARQEPRPVDLDQPGLFSIEPAEPR